MLPLQSPWQVPEIGGFRLPSAYTYCIWFPKDTNLFEVWRLQICTNMTQSVPILRLAFPPWDKGRKCILVRLKVHTTVVYSGMGEFIEKKRRWQGSIFRCHRTAMRNSIWVQGLVLSLLYHGLPLMGKWVGKLHILQSMENPHLHFRRIWSIWWQLHATSQMTKLNRQAIDWLLARQEGVVIHLLMNS